MVLYKLEEFDPDYRDTFEEGDIKGYDVYSDIDNEKIGTVKNIMVDESGHFRYLVVDTGFWIFGKQVLLPIGRIRTDLSQHRIYTIGFTKEQAEALPEFTEDLKIDYGYEERVRDVYRTQPAATTYNRDTYTYQQEPDLYDMGDRDQETLKLYEERLVANKTRQKAGEVSISKQVDTETQTAAVPVETERVVIERTTPGNASTPVSPEEAFHQGEVAHMDLYEETPDIRKETVLCEEVTIRKETEQEMVSASEQVRREELDIDSEGHPVIDKNR
jgi:uncharacterized protein (TIGR02271 family)